MTQPSSSSSPSPGPGSDGWGGDGGLLASREGSRGRVAPAWSINEEEAAAGGAAAASASSPRAPPLSSFADGAGYDYARSTTDVFGAPDPGDRTFTGPFAAIRAGLDYAFHRNYVPGRQGVQDGIVQLFLDADAEASASTSGASASASASGLPLSSSAAAGRGLEDDSLAHVERAPAHLIGPDCRLSASSHSQSGSGRGPHHTPKQWVVFTAGPMGAGKSHCLKWLARRGFFPLDDFVLADPDLIRNELPENAGYIREDPLRAGSQTHQEAGYILEILIRAALVQGRNVLVQGSLRDSAWHAAYFQGLRALYPGLRLAIIHVTAAKSTVLERARRRGEITKRVVPDEVLLASLEQTPRAVAELAPLVDYCVTIDNDGKEPRLVVNGDALGMAQGQGWAFFSGVWRDCHLPTKAEAATAPSEAPPPSRS